MLMEMLFGMVFFLLPVIGMFVAVIARGLQQQEEVEVAEKKAMPHIRGKRQRQIPMPVFVDNPVIRYQLIESKTHVPLKMGRQKRLFHQRAGP